MTPSVDWWSMLTQIQAPSSLVTASPSHTGEQHPVRGWLQGALGRTHHSQGSLGRLAFIPSYQCTRGYSCWELGSSAAWQPEAWLMRAEGISIQNLFREDVPWNWKRIIMPL